MMQVTNRSFSLHEIRKASRLSADEESHLAQCMLRARHEREQPQPDQQVLDEDQAATHRLIITHLHLVVSEARRYSGRGLPLDDLIQEGTLGLLRAADHFDPYRGARFATYAPWWIWQAITRALAEQSRLIRLPVAVGGRLAHLNYAISGLWQELGRDPTAVEIAERLGTTAESVQMLLAADETPLSLDRPLSKGDDILLGESLVDEPLEGFDEGANRSWLKEQIAAALSVLSERERTVLRLRYGLDDGIAHTLEEVGQRFQVSRERIRQIEARALAKLRGPLSQVFA